MPNGRMLLPDERLPTSEPLRYGLLATATELTDLGRHWSAGLTWQPNCGLANGTWDECLVVAESGGVPSTAPEPVDKTARGDAFGLRGAVPFSVFAEADCSVLGSWDDGARRAREALERDEERTVEFAFFTGRPHNSAQVTWPNLVGFTAGGGGPALVDDSAGTGAVLQPPTIVAEDIPLDIVLALSLLESTLAQCYGDQGVIHAPISFSDYMIKHNLITTEGGIARTTVGNRVIFGAGYRGDPPGVNGVPDPAVEWMYATGQVFYARSDINTFSRRESLDRSKDTLHAIAERTYVIGWDCCLIAVAVDRLSSGACCTTGS